LRWAGARHGSGGLAAWSDRQGQFGERGGEAVVGFGVSGEFVVAAAKVLGACVSGGDHLGGAQAFQPAHRPQPGLEPAPDRLRSCCSHTERRGGGRRGAVRPGPAGRPRPGPWSLDRAASRRQRPGEEPTGGGQVPLLAGQHVDDLPELVDRPIQVAPPARDLDICLVRELPVTEAVATRPGGVDQQWSAPADPAADRDVINDEAGVGRAKRAWLGLSRSPQEVAMMMRGQTGTRPARPAQPGRPARSGLSVSLLPPPQPITKRRPPDPTRRHPARVRTCRVTCPDVLLCRYRPGAAVESPADRAPRSA